MSYFLDGLLRCFWASVRSRVLRVVMATSLLFPGGCSRVQALLNILDLTPACVKEAKDRKTDEEKALETGIGSLVVNLLDLEDVGGLAHLAARPAVRLNPSPYLLMGGFPLDPKWYSNRIPVGRLPAIEAVSIADNLDEHHGLTQQIDQNKVLIDLREALGVDPSGAALTPDLKVIYYPGDDLVLESGHEVRFRINEDVEVRESLSNPSLKLAGDGGDVDQEYVPFGLGEVLAIERDLYSNGDLQQLNSIRVAPCKYSGTVIFSKKITLAGDLVTGGYDLVLVADEIDACPGTSIITSPPARPHDDDNGRTAGEYDYGRSKPGYRGGDVIVLCRRIMGDFEISGARAGGVRRSL